MESDSKRALLAVVLSGIVLFGWQYFFPSPTYTPQENKVAAANSDSQQSAKSAAENSENKTNSNLISDDQPKVNKTVSNFKLTRNEFTYTLNNFLDVISAQAINSKEVYPDVYGDTETFLYLGSGNDRKRIYFNFKKVSDHNFEIVSNDNKYSGSVSLSKKGELRYSINSQTPFTFEFLNKSEKIELDSFSHYNQYMVYGNELENIAIGDDDEYRGIPVKWFGLDYDYHFFAIVFESKNIVNVRTFGEERGDKEFGTFRLQSSSELMTSLNFKRIFIQKNYDDLLALGDNLNLSVDFGIWEIIAVPILRGLQFFFDIFPNWGVAIILLTIFIRMLTFPLQYKSFKSMKKMQVIQPELTKIRERYKDNPQKMQQETMALFKKAGANPLGGCLPLLLQMPIFFAFYKVLYTSVELVDAPFIFWIKDLSEMDPYYVLPILMSLAMFLNMKLTPSPSADPTQQKIMMFMPLIFGFMMMSLPAGLTLYIFISTVMGMFQQLFVYKRVS